MKKFWKKYHNWVIAAILIVGLDIYHKGFFLTGFLIYAFFIKFIFSDIVKGKLKRILQIAIWVSLIPVFIFVKDTSALEIFSLGIVFAGIVISEKDKESK